ncbi:hypothetical protein D3C76_1303340 [compost metagenome]
MRTGIVFLMEQLAEVRKYVGVEADFAGVGGGDEDQHFKNQHLRVGAYRTREEERGVHHEAHQRGEGGEGTENEPDADQEFAVRHHHVEEVDVRQGEVLQEGRPPALHGGMVTGAVRNRSGQEACGVEAAGQFMIAGFDPLIAEVNADDGQEPHCHFVCSKEIVKHDSHSFGLSFDFVFRMIIFDVFIICDFFHYICDLNHIY